MRTYQVGGGALVFQELGSPLLPLANQPGKGRLAVRAAASGTGALTVSIVSDTSDKGGLRTEKEFSLLVYFLVHV